MWVYASLELMYLRKKKQYTSKCYNLHNLTEDIIKIYKIKEQCSIAMAIKMFSFADE